MAADTHGRTSRLELADQSLREWDAFVLDSSPEGVVLDRSAAGLAMGLRRGVVDSCAGIGDPRAGVPRRGGDHDLGPVRSSGT